MTRNNGRLSGASVAERFDGDDHGGQRAYVDQVALNNPVSAAAAS
ncbi:MAG: hypothetical protein ACRDOL_21320 [Streptosporangiaceae bacterium]